MTPSSIGTSAVPLASKGHTARHRRPHSRTGRRVRSYPGLRTVGSATVVTAGIHCELAVRTVASRDVVAERGFSSTSQRLTEKRPGKAPRRTPFSVRKRPMLMQRPIEPVVRTGSRDARALRPNGTNLRDRTRRPRAGRCCCWGKGSTGPASSIPRNLPTPHTFAPRRTGRSPRSSKPRVSPAPARTATCRAAPRAADRGERPESLSERRRGPPGQPS